MSWHMNYYYWRPPSWTLYWNGQSHSHSHSLHCIFQRRGAAPVCSGKETLEISRFCWFHSSSSSSSVNQRSYSSTLLHAQICSCSTDDWSDPVHAKLLTQISPCSTLIGLVTGLYPGIFVDFARSVLLLQLITVLTYVYLYSTAEQVSCWSLVFYPLITIDWSGSVDAGNGSC